MERTNSDCGLNPNFEITPKYQLEAPNNLKDFLLPLVEFFGILVPGVVFVISLVPSVIIPLVVLFKAVTIHIEISLEQHSLVLKIIEFYNHIINKIFLITEGGFNKTYGLLFLIFSYVVGHIFFRQDIKNPDFKSFKKTSKRYKKTGPVLWKERKKSEKYNDYAKFPYGDLKGYLNRRGMDHLSRKIQWEGYPEKENKKYRYKTKHFINIVKIRLEFLFPRQYVKIQKNEAHVRLMSSTWYVLNTITYISLTSISSGSICYDLILFYFKISFSSTHLYSLILLYIMFPPITICIISYHLRGKIENFLHYQRVREIIFILEMAHFADSLRPDLNILKFDEPPGNAEGFTQS